MEGVGDIELIISALKKMQNVQMTVLEYSVSICFLDQEGKTKLLSQCSFFVRLSVRSGLLWR